MNKYPIIVMTMSLLFLAHTVEAQNFALQFDGSQDYVQVPYDSALYPSALTAECWFRTTGESGQQEPLIGNFDNSSSAYGIELDSRCGRCAVFYFQVGSTLYQTWPSGSLNDSNWHHVALVWDGGNLKGFVDGVSVTTIATSGGIGNGHNPFYVGRDLQGFFAPVAVDEVRISNVARYTTNFPPVTGFTVDSNTVAYWRFNTGTGTTAFDETGGHNGTLIGNLQLPSWVGGIGPPVASFTAAPTNGFAPLSVNFTDTSTGLVTNWFWNFGDGDTTNLTTHSVVYTYKTGGVYTVSEIVAGPEGASTNVQPNYIVVFDCPTITLSPNGANPTVLTGGAVGTPYSQTITASGGVGSYTYAETGTLPPGLTLSSAGVLSGTPAASGTYNFTVTATDTNGCPGSQAYSVTMTCPTITLSPNGANPTVLTGGAVGTPYSQTITSSGGVGPYTYAVNGGTLPAGLSLSSAGVLSGTPTTVGSYSFTIQANDANGCPGTQSYAVTINCPTITLSPNGANPTVLTGGAIGTAYSQTITANGGTGPYTYAETGTLPTGVTLSSAGVLSGSPTASGTYTFTVTATDIQGCMGSQAYSVYYCPILMLSPSSPLPGGTLGTAYSQTITASNGVGPYTFTANAASSCDADPSGMVAWWPGNGNANDIQGSNNGTLVGGVSFASGIVGQAFSLNGSTAYVQVPDSSLWAFGTNNFTIELWANFASSTFGAIGNPVNGVFISNDQGGGGQPKWWFALGGGVLHFHVNGGAGGQLFLVQAPFTPNVNQWYHLALERNGSLYTIYVNGVAVGSQSDASAIPTPNAPLTIGEAEGFYFKGSLDEVSIYNRALSAPEIHAIYNAGSAGKCPPSTPVEGLPPGLGLSAGGVLDGTPTVVGTYNFTMTATDTQGCTGTQSNMVTISCPTITLSPNGANPTVLTGGKLGTAYSQMITASGGTGPYAYIETGALPTGVTLSSAGVLSGTPTGAGTYTFTVTATDTNGCQGSQTYSVTMTCPTITLSPNGANPTVLTGGAVGTAYSQTITASGGTSPYVFNVTSGTLPAGLSLSSAGVLSGTPTVVGSYSFTIQANDVNGCPGTQSYAVSINCSTITLSPNGANPTVLTSGVIGIPYSEAITASGGTAPYAYAETGTLPTGVTLSSSGVLSGTPTASGTYTFTVTATDAQGCPGSQAYSVFYCPTLMLSPTNLPVGTLGAAYSQTITAINGVGPYTFMTSAPSNCAADPSGMVAWWPGNGNANDIQGINNGTLIGGATFASGIVGQAFSLNGSTAYVQVPDSSLWAFGTNNFTIELWANFRSPGSSFQPLVGHDPGNGGEPKWIFVLESGFLAFHINGGADGPIYLARASFSPNANQWYHLAVERNGSLYTIYVNGVAVGSDSNANVIPDQATPLTIGEAEGDYFNGLLDEVSIYNRALSASEIQAIHNVGSAGKCPAFQSLPPGLGLSAGGVLAGTPTAVGTYNFTVSVTDTNGCSGSQAYSVTMTCPTLTLSPNGASPTVLTVGTVGTAYSQTITASGGSGSCIYAETGTLPTGVLLSSAGVLSGTPTVSGIYTFTVTATDTNGCQASQTYSVTICSTITLSPNGANPTVLNGGVVGTGYSQTITASGGIGTYAYTSTVGILPTGLSLSSAGILSGTPTAAGVYNFTVTATDTNGCQGSQTYSVTICSTITLSPNGSSPTVLTGGTLGVAYSQTITASGGMGSYTYTTTAGTLPTGLTLSSAGVLSGTPTTVGSYSFTVQASDANGCSATQNYMVTMVCPMITLSPSSLSIAVAGVNYSQTITSSGGNGPYAYAQTGALPAGVTLSSGGVLSGTPTVTGTYPITMTTTDQVTGCTGTRSYTLRVTCPIITFSPSSLPSGTVGSPYSTTISPNNGVPSYAFLVSSGALPTGLNLDPSTGILSGTPTAAGSFTFTVEVFDVNGCPGTMSYTVQVGCPTVTLSSLTNGMVAMPYSQTITASGGTGPYTFSLLTGAPPSGLNLSAAGVLSGTPTTSSNVTFTVLASDLYSCAGTQQYTIAIFGNFEVTSITRTGNDILVIWTCLGNHSYVLQSTKSTAMIAGYTTNYADASPMILASGLGPTMTNYLDVGSAYAPVVTPPGGQNVTTSVVPSTVSISATGTRGITDSLGQSLGVGSLLMLGTFSISEPIIQSNFNAGNVSAIMSNFTPYSTLFKVGDGTDLPASWDVSLSAAGFGGKQIYLLAVDNRTLAAANHLGIYTAAAWVFPADGNEIDIDLADVTDFVVGKLGGSLTINQGLSTYTFNDTAKLSVLPGRILFYRVRLVQ